MRAFFHRCQHCWPVCTAPIRLPSLTARSWLRRWRRCTRSPRCPTSTLPFTLSCCSSRSATKSVLDCFHHFKSEHLFDSFGIISLICSLGSDQLNWLILFHRARIWRAITVPIGFSTGSNLGWLGVSREFNLCAMPHTFWKTWPFSTGDGVRGWVSHGSLLQRLLPEVDEPGLGKLVKACPLPQPDLQGHEERPCAHQGPCVRQAFDAALHLLVKKIASPGITSPNTFYPIWILFPCVKLYAFNGPMSYLLWYFLLSGKFSHLDQWLVRYFVSRRCQSSLWFLGARRKKPKLLMNQCHPELKPQLLPPITYPVLLKLTFHFASASSGKLLNFPWY